jgi:xanthine dehydrogenase YagS FAD-binding subunit
VVLGGVAAAPWRAREAEDALVGEPLTSDVVEAAASASTAGAEPLSENGYKIRLVEGVVREALRRLEPGA